jgi:hypothetical protein
MEILNLNVSLLFPMLLRRKKQSYGSITRDAACAGNNNEIDGGVVVAIDGRWKFGLKHPQ